MINFYKPMYSSKWRNETPFTVSTAYVEDYSRHFQVAVHNLEMNLQEERLNGKKRKRRKK